MTENDSSEDEKESVTIESHAEDLLGKEERILFSIENQRNGMRLPFPVAFRQHKEYLLACN